MYNYISSAIIRRTNRYVCPVPSRCFQTNVSSRNWSVPGDTHLRAGVSLSSSFFFFTRVSLKRFVPPLIRDNVRITPRAGRYSDPQFVCPSHWTPSCPCCLYIQLRVACIKIAQLCATIAHNRRD